MSDEQQTPKPAGSGLTGLAWFQRLAATKRPQMSEFGAGDQVRVWCRIKERDRVRLAPFEGLVIRRRGAGLSETFTVRRVTHGEGVERVFPLHSPTLDHVEVLRRGHVHRARLYFLRTKIGKTKIQSADSVSRASSAAGPRTSPEPSANVPTDLPVAKP